MRKEKKISTIRLMMLISQLLLIIFLGYWLFSQFNENKRLLTKEIERGLRKSEQQVIDSMLAINIINPILNDTNNYSVFLFDTLVTDSLSYPGRIKFTKDSVPQLLMHVSKGGKQIYSSQRGSHSMQQFGVSIVDSSHGMNPTKITVHSKQDTNNQLLFQSVRLIIDAVGDFPVGEMGIPAYFNSNIDTSLLKNLFHSYIETDYPDFSIEWISLTGQKSDKTSSGIFLNSQLFEDQYGAKISNYKTHLLGSISPQIIFAIILLLITSIAFRMAFVSLRNQRRLITIKNDFISNISHELKTPVSTVKVALEALLDFDLKKDSVRTKEYLEMAHSQTNRLDLLVNQVLNNSALEDGENFIFPERIDLVTIIEEVLQSWHPHFEKAEAKVNFDHEHDKIFVHADKLHIHGVIANLIDNSLKYCDSKPIISIELSQNKRETTLTISDKGIGIPDEFIDKVFDKFFRIPTGDKHNIKGFGLGLNYAALVMNHHNGNISVKNLDEGGCKFTISFPNKD